MAQRTEIATVYASGLVQGIALIAFPAASTILTDPAGYDLSQTQYGTIFAPEAILAVLSSLMGAGLMRRLGAKRLYLFGLGADIASMALFLASKLAMGEHAIAYGILIAATCCIGIAFGFTVPALNTFTAAFFPENVGRAILWLNALLGLGTALAPVFVAIFVSLGIWWGLPLLVGVLFVALLLVSLPQSLNEGAQRREATAQSRSRRFPARFWLFAVFVFLYGLCETMSGNWASIYMLNHLGASAFLASAALALFWGTVTAGRIFFATVEKWLPESVVFRTLPFVIAAAFALCAYLPKTNAGAGLLTFALSGVGCSALLPLTISFGQRELTAIASSVAGGLIAFYETGFGIAAFGVGPLQTGAGFELNKIFGVAAVIAVVMAILSFVVVRPEKRAVMQISNANT
jgi:MFS family permease